MNDFSLQQKWDLDSYDNILFPSKEFNSNDFTEIETKPNGTCFWQSAKEILDRSPDRLHSNKRIANADHAQQVVVGTLIEILRGKRLSVREFNPFINSINLRSFYKQKIRMYTTKRENLIGMGFYASQVIFAICLAWRNI